MKNVPEKIFLVLGDDEKPPKDFNELDHEFVCWCQDRINKNDIEYRIVKKRKKTNQPDKTTLIP